MSIMRNVPRRLLEMSIAINIFLFIFIFLPHDSAQGALGQNMEEGRWWRIPKGVLERLGRKPIEPEHAWEAGVEEQVVEVDGPTSEERQGGCTLCEMDPALCQELGKENLERALSFAGTGMRFRRMLSKLKRGERLVAGVIGGSVSSGHGIDLLPGWKPDQSTNLHRIIFDRIDHLYPAPNGAVTGKNGRAEGMNSYVNGAQGASGSQYFSLCYREHLPEDMDVVFVELAINDEVLLSNMDSYEILIRSLLDLPNKPAILALDVFALMFKTVANGGDLHSGISQYYDLPTISLRNALYEQVLANSSIIPELFSIDRHGELDLRHINLKGHNLLGRMGAAYVDSQVCEMEKYEDTFDRAEGMSLDELYPLAPLPRLRLNQPYDSTTHLPQISPQCFSTNGLKHPLLPLPSSALGPNGWHPWQQQDSHKKYLISTTPGARVSFELHTSLGRVDLHYLRSESFGLGSVRCWVDGREGEGVRLDGYWEKTFNIGQTTTIKDGLSIGKHILTCEHLNETKDPKGGKEFRLISAMR
ncbi:hypothetical protein I350_05691 [Cryptococcus amylolentus CBS 6273]|uniref:SGNH hydrolase-type esterase domain-containing protein n=1 Tax=Cryptococcus amylolentus CBS 6273 TaxID=1296118 RepID=A0A1E3JPR3_9TREE|nr:hypothetical protein I350_05691 [Cryptococcus amylolentus CBS 6273]